MSHDRAPERAALQSRVAVAAAFVLSLVACDIPLTEGRYACTDDRGCPEGWICATDQRCYRSCATGPCVDDAGADAGTDAGTDAGVDAATPPTDAGTDGGTDAGLDPRCDYDVGDAGGPGGDEANCCCDPRGFRACGSLDWTLEIAAPAGADGGTTPLQQVYDVALDDRGFVHVAAESRGTEGRIAGSALRPEEERTLSRGGHLIRVSPDGEEICWATELPLAAEAAQSHFNEPRHILPFGDHVYFQGALGHAPAAWQTSDGETTLTDPRPYVGRVSLSDGHIDWVRALQFVGGGRSDTARAVRDMAVVEGSVYLVGTVISSMALDRVGGGEILQPVGGGTFSGPRGVLIRLEQDTGLADWVAVFGTDSDSSTQADGVAVRGNDIAVVGTRFGSPTVRVYRSSGGVPAPATTLSFNRGMDTGEGQGRRAAFVGDQLVVLGAVEEQLVIGGPTGVCFAPAPSPESRPFLITLDITGDPITVVPDSGSPLPMTHDSRGFDEPASALTVCEETREVLLGGTFSGPVGFTPMGSVSEQFGGLVAASVPPGARESATWVAAYPALNPAGVAGIAARPDRLVFGGVYTSRIDFGRGASPLASGGPAPDGGVPDAGAADAGAPDPGAVRLEREMGRGGFVRSIARSRPAEAVDVDRTPWGYAVADCVPDAG